MAESSSKKTFFWKGKRVTEKVYNSRIRQVEVGKNLRSVYGCKNEKANPKESAVQIEKLEGRRIMHLKTVSQYLFCKCQKCSAMVPLSNTVDETRIGLASIFIVQCQVCQGKTRFATDKTHQVKTKNARKKSSNHYDVNTRVAMGALNGGMGNTHINKLLASLNIPQFHVNCYKTHEIEVGTAVEKMAQDSCIAATLLERELSIQNIDKLKNLLPAHLNTQFLFPTLPEINPKILGHVQPEDIVRIAASFDMGWTTRGTGRNYDSLTGSAALIGLFTKKVLSYTSKNRKCRKCDRGHDFSDHDCRLNFEGSAKAMESKAAVQLATENSIFEACHVQLGIMIGDNDSSAIASVRAANHHEVIKHSDKNHTSKGVVNELYKIKKNHSELTSVAIKYLQRCFNYCVAQNTGDAAAMAKAIRNIPYHCFNNHDNCGEWCGYRYDPESYTHSTIGDGFQSEKSFDALRCIFDIIASKTDRFAAGVSSNVNESLNSIIASKAPKSRSYGTTASGDARLACAINKKNDGEKYLIELSKKLSLSPAKYTEKYGATVDSNANKRYLRSSTRQFKKRRLFLKAKKTELRHKKERSEGSQMYQSDMGLLNVDMPSIPEIQNSSPSSTLVFFDLETGGFSKTADLLQIAAKHESSDFSIYVTPTQKIDEKASNVTGLRVVAGQLECHGKVVTSVALPDALLQFYNFLRGLKKKCVLVAHNCTFDRSRLLAAIQKTFLIQHFEAVIFGFSDSLPIIKKITKLKGKGDNKLEKLADTLQISTSNAHNAADDVVILEQVIIKLGISNQTFFESTLTWDEAIKKQKFNGDLPKALKKLINLKTCTSFAIRKKIIAADISYELILDTYKKYNLMGLMDLFGEDENGKIKVTKSRCVAKKICDYLEKNIS